LEKANSLSGSIIEKTSLKNTITNKSIYGIDAGNDPKMYRIARMNMYLHGDGGSNIYLADSLDKNIGQIGKTSLEYKRDIQELRKKILEEELKFDVILSNPPFAMKYSREDSEQQKILDEYELAFQDGNNTTSLLSSVMCLERYYELLSESGRVLAIIDDSVLSGDSYKVTRNYIRDKFIIEGIVSLPGDAFKRSASRVKTSVLILRKKLEDEQQPNVFLDSSIYLGLEDKIAKRIGLRTQDLEKQKESEIKKIISNYKLHKSGSKTKYTYPEKNIQGRLDVKYCIHDTGRKRRKWKKAGYSPVKIEKVLSSVKQGREQEVLSDNEYQFLRVNYQGDVIDGEIVQGSECSYSKLYAVKAWDIVMSNMGVGRGAIGIVPPHLEGKFLSNEYTILTAKSHEEAVYYSNIIKTKEILGDILTTTTGMNRGRILWDDIKNVEVPQYSSKDSGIKTLVKNLENYWKAYNSLQHGTDRYMNKKSSELELNDSSAKERWLAFKPPE
jgi:type I restriction enzyme M protein